MGVLTSSGGRHAVLGIDPADVAGPVRIRYESIDGTRATWSDLPLVLSAPAAP